MEGAYKAKFFVNEFLKKDVPQRVFDYRNAKRPEGQWFLDDETLPTPGQLPDLRAGCHGQLANNYHIGDVGIKYVKNRLCS